MWRAALLLSMLAPQYAGAARGRPGCDFDGDGAEDLVVGATQRFGPPRDAGPGRVFVYHSRKPEEPLVLVEPEGERGGYGGPLACAGDVDGDGFADLLVGAPQTIKRMVPPRPDMAPTVEQRDGRVYLYRGSVTGLAAGRRYTLSAPREPAEWDVSSFGESVAGGGDLDGDGLADIVVAASLGGPGGLRTRHYIYLGARTGPAAPAAHLDTTPGEMTLAQPSAGFAGDLDGDGFADLYLAIDHGGADQRSGRVEIHGGGPGGLRGAAPVVLRPPGAPRDFGYRAACAGDVDGDGHDDLVVSSYHGRRAWLFRGGKGPLSAVPAVVLKDPSKPKDPEVDPTYFGAALLGGADLDGDGLADVVVGAPGWAGYTGRVHVFFGDAKKPLSRVETRTGPAKGETQYGTALALADLDHDSVPDLAVGTGCSACAPRVFLHRGAPARKLADPTRILQRPPDTGEHFGWSLAVR